MSDRLKDYAIFMRIVEAGGFGAAARTLAMSPSAVSKIVTRLEERLHVRLFLRNARSITLTEEGRGFAEAIRPALDAIENAELGLSQASAMVGGLRIHAPPTFALHQLAPLLPRFRLLYPGIRLDLVLGNEPVDLVGQAIDIAIRDGHFEESSLKVRRLAFARWLICAAPSYLERHGAPQTPVELGRHTCLTFAMHTTWNRWPLQGLGGAVEGAITANNGEMLAELARGGCGIACLADYHIHEDLEAGRLVELLRPHHSGATSPLVALFAPGGHTSPRVRAFLDLAIAHFAAPPWQAKLGEAAI